mgnify:CR=1 FL=1
MIETVANAVLRTVINVEVKVSTRKTYCPSRVRDVEVVERW